MDTPDPRIQIQPMGLDTLREVEALEQECFSNPWSLDSLADELSNPIAVVRTAAINGKVVGYAGMHHIIDEGYITNIAVTQSHRRTGVATALMEELIRYAEENDLRMLTLEVRPSNHAAIAFYKKFNFEQEGRRTHYYTNPTEDALILTLRT